MYSFKKNCPPTYRLHIQKNGKYHLWWETARGHRIPQKTAETFHKLSKTIFADKEYDNFNDLVDAETIKELFAEGKPVKAKDKYGRCLLLFTEKQYTNPVYTFMQPPAYSIFAVCVESGKLYIAKTTEKAYSCTVTSDVETISHSLYKHITSKDIASHLLSDEYEVIREILLF